MKKIILWIGLCLGVFTVHAQPALSDFTSLESQGAVPEDVKTFALSKNQDDLFLRNLFVNGDVLFGTTLNDYVNTVADNLLKDYPDLRKELRFYILKSPVVNAFATDKGIILINLGLLAQVSNESKLAFVMAHEIVHYVEHHLFSLTDYASTLKDNDVVSYYLKYHNRSREQELVADKLGLERYYQSSPYSLDVLDGIFDVLQFADLPFDEIPCTRDFVETSFYQFPDKYFLQTVAQIDSRDDHIDTLSTHPNIKKRRETAKTLVASMNHDGRQIFVQSESLFNQVRALARFECINLFLTEQDFGPAIYNTYVLLKQYPDNTFLNTALAAGFYGYAKHKNSGNSTDILTSYKDIEGEQQQVHYFLSKLSRNESTVLALRFVWKQFVQHPDNPYLDAICSDLMKVMKDGNHLDYNDFSDYPMGIDIASIPQDTAQTTPDTYTGGGKYDRIKSRTSLKKIVPTEKFKTVNYMLVDIHQDSLFLRKLQDVKHDQEDEEVTEVVKDYSAIKNEKLLVTTPICVTKYKKMSADKQYRKSVKNSEDITRVLHTITKKMNINADFLDNADLATSNIEQYNCYVKLKQWINEYASSQETEMIYYQSIGIDKVIERYGTPYISIVATIDKNEQFYFKWRYMYILEIILSPYSIPIAGPALFWPIAQNNTGVLIVNLSTGETVMSNTLTAYSSINRAYRNSFIYNQFYQIYKAK